MSVGMCPLSNQLIPLTLNDDTAASCGNGVSFSDSEVSEVSIVLDLSSKERVVWLQMRRKNRHKPPFLVPKKEKPNRRLFNLHMLYTQS